MRIMAAVFADQEEPPESFSKQPHVMYFLIKHLMEIFKSDKTKRAETNVTLFFAAFVVELNTALCEKVLLSTGFSD